MCEFAIIGQFKGPMYGEVPPSVPLIAGGDHRRFRGTRNFNFDGQNPELRTASLTDRAACIVLRFGGCYSAFRVPPSGTREREICDVRPNRLRRLEQRYPHGAEILRPFLSGRCPGGRVIYISVSGMPSIPSTPISSGPDGRKDTTPARDCRPLTHLISPAASG